MFNNVGICKPTHVLSQHLRYKDLYKNNILLTLCKTNNKKKL